MSALAKAQWTYCCVWVLPGIALLMVNDAQRSTRSLVAYDDLHPVVIRELP